MIYAILFHSFTLTFIFHYNFVHLYGFSNQEPILTFLLSKIFITDLISNFITSVTEKFV